MLFSRNISDLDQWVSLECPANAPNGQGGFTTIWATKVTVPARILSTTAKDARQSDQAVMIIRHTVSIRHRRDVRSSWRIKHKNKYYSIEGIINPEMANEWLDIVCREAAK